MTVKKPSDDSKDLSTKEGRSLKEDEAALARAAGLGRRRRAVVVTVALGAVVAGALLWLSASDQGSRWIASVFSGRFSRLLDEVSASATASASTEEAASSGSPRQLEVASLSLVDSTGADDLSRGPAGEAASFDRPSPRWVRRVRGRGADGSEQGLASRPRDHGAVRARVQAVAPSIQRCYERAMATRGHLRGTLQVTFSASSSGSISDVTVRSSSVQDQGLLLCVRSHLAPVRLGRGPIERYTVPLRLVPTEPERGLN